MGNYKQGYGNSEEIYCQSSDEKAQLFTPQELVSSTQEQLQRRSGYQLAWWRWLRENEDNLFSILSELSAVSTSPV